MNILQALDDPNLFARHFRAEPWRRWRVFLAALFGLPMDDEQLAIYRQHTARTTPPTEPFKEAALVVGRRGGKSRMLALTATYLSTFRSYEESLAPGEVATVAVIAADRRQARVIFRYTDGLFRAVPMLAGMIDSARDEVIRLNNRVVIEIHTANFRVTRGYTFAAVLADETAFWRDEFSANPDVEIFRALLPGLGTIPSSMLLNASSPYRRAGVLYHTYRRHYGQDAGRVLVWQAPTAEMNPTIDPEIIAEAYDEDRERGGRVWRTVPRGHRRLRVPRGGRRPHTPGPRGAPAVQQQQLPRVRRSGRRQRQRQHDPGHLAQRGRPLRARRAARDATAVQPGGGGRGVRHPAAHLPGDHRWWATAMRASGPGSSSASAVSSIWSPRTASRRSTRTSCRC